jgi:hypothetical protein
MISLMMEADADLLMIRLSKTMVRAGWQPCDSALTIVASMTTA